MKQARTPLFRTLCLVTLLTAALAGNTLADEYGDVNQLLRASKFTEAMTKVDAYLVNKPADPQMRFLKGVIQRNQGKQAEAISTFTKLTEDYPELPEPYNNLAVLYAGQGQYDRARVALEMAIRTNPSYATAHENMGDVYARLASQAYNKALQLDSANVAVPPKLAMIREVFKPNLTNSRPLAVAAAAATATPTPAPVAAQPTPAATPTPVTKPVVAPPVVAPVAAAKPNVVAKPALAADDTVAVEDAVLAWAKAWSAKDMKSYLAAYSPQFTPPGKQSRSSWEKDRNDRITGKSRISVKVTELNAKVTSNDAVARFRQAYKSDSLSVSSRKTLQLQKINNQWLIVKESTGN